MGLVQWLAVFGLLWVFGCGGLRCSSCCGFLGAVACGVWVVVGFGVQWLAVSRRCFGWLVVGLV